jgi:serine/threonine protein kinase
VWSVGQRIGDYELLAHLRSGGMAMLFLARRIGAAGFTRDVAIKIVNPELASDSQFRTMFLDEAVLSSRIQHPNVVHVEELGEHEGSHYLVMEYVHGCSLSQLQRQLVGRGRRLSPSFATRIAMYVAEALHAAHESRDEQGRVLNVVHRDVSPENILLAYAGHVKLIDFGIAKAYGRRHKTQEGLLKGKFRYMAPEQAYGKGVDRRTDIYQLGIVLWEMLTLRRLFDAETDVDLLAQVRDPRIPPPSALVDRIPPALDAAVMAALDPEPNRRPADALTFARILGKAALDAHEVDSGALSSLVVATMHEHRQREKQTFPDQVYERLEQQIETLQMVANPVAAAQPVLKKYTFEHTSPYGSDAPSDAASPAQRPPHESTRHGYGSPGRGASQRPPAPELQSGVPERFRGQLAAQSRASRGDLGSPSSNPPRVVHPHARQRRLVRLASELRTTITRMTGETPRERRMLWLALGCSVGLAGALAVLTLALRTRPKLTPPPLPTLVVPAVVQTSLAPTPVVAPVPPAGNETPGTDGGLGPLDAPSVIVAPGAPAASSSDTAAHHHHGDRLAAPVDIDGTPMIPEF